MVLQDTMPPNKFSNDIDYDLVDEWKETDCIGFTGVRSHEYNPTQAHLNDFFNEKTKLDDVPGFSNIPSQSDMFYQVSGTFRNHTMTEGQNSKIMKNVFCNKAINSYAEKIRKKNLTLCAHRSRHSSAICVGKIAEMKKY
jgi:hypothetical protein